MVSYCTGNVQEKRRIFRSFRQSEGVLSIDNDEILATFSLGGKMYFVVGDAPFGDMTAEQYIACQHSLISRLNLKRSSIRLMLASLGLKVNPRARMKTLTRTQYRAVCLISRLDENIHTLYLNFDGLEYSRRAKRDITRLSVLYGTKYDMYIAVSDSRLIPAGARTLLYKDGGVEEKCDSRKTRVIGRGTLKRKLRGAKIDLSLPKGRAIAESIAI